MVLPIPNLNLNTTQNPISSAAGVSSGNGAVTFGDFAPEFNGSAVTTAVAKLPVVLGIIAVAAVAYFFFTKHKAR